MVMLTCLQTILVPGLPLCLLPTQPPIHFLRTTLIFDITLVLSLCMAKILTFLALLLVILTTLVLTRFQILPPNNLPHIS